MPKSYIGGFQKVTKNRGQYDDDELPTKKKNKPPRGNKRSQVMPIQDSSNENESNTDFEDFYDNEY